MPISLTRHHSSEFKRNNQPPSNLSATNKAMRFAAKIPTIREPETDEQFLKRAMFNILIGSLAGAMFGWMGADWLAEYFQRQRCEEEVTEIKRENPNSAAFCDSWNEMVEPERGD